MFFMKKEKVSEQEIAEVMGNLAKIRELNDPPTRKEAEEIIIRQKKRWGIVFTETN